MKEYIIKQDFKLRQIGENYIVVALGKESKRFNGMINLNSTGAFMWKKLDELHTKEGLIEALMAEYDVEEAKASADIDSFIKVLQDNGIFE